MGLFVFMAAVAILTLSFSYYCFRICFYSQGESGSVEDHIPSGAQYESVRERMLTVAKRMEEAPCEHITISGYKCGKLHGRYYAVDANAPIMLIFHGYRGVTFRDCAGGFALGKKLGFNILAVDQRCHGESNGHVITFGIRERYDCQRWAEYAAKRFPRCPIILSGVSMGAATVLMASELALPAQVACIMADCPYTAPMDIIGKVADDMGYPGFLSRPLIWLGGLIYGRFNVCSASALSAIKNAKIPVLLIHGEDDLFVPCNMSRALKDAGGENAALHTFPQAGHGLSYLVDPHRYEQICIEFLNSIPVLRDHMENCEYVRNHFSA